jgi:hypothetical protein
MALRVQLLALEALPFAPTLGNLRQGQALCG